MNSSLPVKLKPYPSALYVTATATEARLASLRCAFSACAGEVRDAAGCGLRIAADRRASQSNCSNRDAALAEDLIRARQAACS